MRGMKRLTALEVSRLNQPGRYGDGGGLWLQVSEFGTKAWLFRYMLAGKARHMGLGPVHTVTLAMARGRRRWNAAGCSSTGSIRSTGVRQTGRKLA